MFGRESKLNKHHRSPSCVARHLLTEEQINEIIKDFKRLLNVRLTTQNDEWFAVGDLIGYDNKDWHGEPCQAIYDVFLEIYRAKYGEEEAHKKAFSQAAKDAGYFYYNILGEHKEIFIADYGYRNKKRVRKYIRVKQ